MSQMQPFSLFAWLNGGEPDANLTVRLYTARDLVIPAPQVSNFQEADFEGYYPCQFPSPRFVQILQNGTAYINFPSLYWQKSNPDDVGPNLLGVFTVATRSDKSQVVLGWSDFPAPVDLDGNGFVLIEQFSVTAGLNVVAL